MKTIPRIRKATGTVAAPPSKSYTVRAILLAAMSAGRVTVRNPLDSDDSRYAVAALRTIGFDVTGDFAKGLVIGERLSMSANEVEISIGNAGTAMRFLASYLTFTPGRFLLTGEKRMLERPIADLFTALVSIGGELEYAGREGYPPLRIRGKKMRGGFEVPLSGVVSSQFISSLMMAGATLPGGITIQTTGVSSRPYIDITRDILERFGATVTFPRPGLIQVSSGGLSCESYEVEGDYSSASYWFAAAAATGGSVTVTGIPPRSVQGDRRFLDVLQAMGCRHSGKSGAVQLEGPAQLVGGSFDCNAIPDIVPTLAAIAPLASSPVEITNVANLRVKESDRLAVLSRELRKLGATVEERPDGLLIQPGWNDLPVTIEPENDHRMAMAFAIAGLARGGVSIASEGVVSKSYPRFWRDLEGLVVSSE